MLRRALIVAALALAMSIGFGGTGVQAHVTSYGHWHSDYNGCGAWGGDSCYWHPTTGCRWDWVSEQWYRASAVDVYWQGAYQYSSNAVVYGC